ncbi:MULTISPECIES: hypothetical protein [Cryobacterium]|uniref:hypothetical protein n=1 Tax=Cryobacterium TaxID=69578 RepID=UPI0010575BC5|nr:MULTISPECIES: hypothetical protein [Cryobacterium]TFC45996.1 hypothetical protein E3O57_07480 [Cryobacterium sp. TMN-39-2]
MVATPGLDAGKSTSGIKASANLWSGSTLRISQFESWTGLTALDVNLFQIVAGCVCFGFGILLIITRVRVARLNADLLRGLFGRFGESSARKNTPKSTAWTAAGCAAIGSVIAINGLVKLLQ